MRYPPVRYGILAGDQCLLLHSYDASVRVVTFETLTAVKLALRPGRAELDCVGISNGFLPLGARHVSYDGAHRGPGSVGNEVEHAESASGNEDGYIDRERDALARRNNPKDSRRYDDITGDMALRAIGNEHAVSARTDH